ncbi:MAG: TIGR02449 family protein [Gammaproteobacteria bacterium]|nr:MAG: TIGR02449 family protein [Gammaproteobacteria bacterium]
MNALEQRFKQLEARIDELTDLCNTYKRHNNSLRIRESQLNEERANLLRQNDMARTKVEAMISRLKTLEQET